MTKNDKQSIIKGEDSVLFHAFWKRFQKVSKKLIGSTFTLFSKRPSVGKRSLIMNTLFKKMNGRFATVLVAGLVVILLAACGGGGGSDASSPASVVTAPAGFPIEPQKAVVAPNLCVTSPDGHTMVGAQCLVTETVTGPVKTTLKSAPRGALQSVAPTTSPISPDEFMDAAERILPNLFYPPAKTTPADGFVYRYYADTNSYIGIMNGGVYTLFMNEDGVVKYIAQMDTFTCAVRPTSAECPQVLRYTDKVYALWTGAYPFVVTKTGVTKVTNKTKYTVGFYPLFNCWIAEKQLNDGKILVSCVDSAGQTRRTLYINPEKDELHEYVGTVPADVVWRDVTPFNLDRHQNGWDSQAKVADGWYYTLLTGDWVLWFIDDHTGVSTVVKSGTFQADGNINYLSSYTN